MMVTQVFFYLVAVPAAFSTTVRQRITGGFEAKPKKEFVALEIEFEHGIRTCGGLLIEPGDKVVTAGSCVFE